MKVLIISAHPDDMEIGMGGTVAKLCESGFTVVSVILTDGRRAPNPFSFSPEQMAEVRQLESERAAAILGVSEAIFFELESLASANNYQSAIQKLAKIIDSISPVEIYTLHPELDRHSSHALSGKVTLEALNKSHKANETEVWAYEVWGLFANWDRFEDITNQIGKKLKAISEHQSQLAAIPYVEGIAGLNRWRAVFADPQHSKPSAAYAEVFLKLK